MLPPVRQDLYRELGHLDQHRPPCPWGGELVLLILLTFYILPLLPQLEHRSQRP